MQRSLWPEQAVIVHAANPAGRDFVAGDLHGHFDTLEHALGELRFDPDRDRLFSVGDLIDRGPRSADALQWLASGRILAVRGNHEQMLVHSLALEDGRLLRSGYGAQWFDNGGSWWWGFFGVDKDRQALWRDVNHHTRRAEWLEAMHQVPYLRRVETTGGPVGIAHTMGDYHRDWRTREDAMTQGAARAQQAPYPYMEYTPTDMLWTRPEIERANRDAPDLPPAMHHIALVLIGHTPDRAPRWTRQNVLCIDTGVHVPDYGHLTLAQVETGEPTLHSFARREDSAHQ